MESKMFLEALRAVQVEVEKRIDGVLEREFEEAAGLSVGAGKLVEVLKEFTLRGGKRLRAAMVVYGYRCLSGEDSSAVWDVATAIELIQSFLLIHDDVIDEDETRRGGWTVHRYYELLARERESERDARRFGGAMAILCGDLALAVADQVIGGIPLEGEMRRAFQGRMSRMIREVIYGEAMDVLSEMEQDLSEEEILLIGRLKTASYTVEGPLHLGAILGGAGSSDLERLSRYAVPLGEAFQVQDDILGMFGDAGRLGKPVGSDVREGKKTFLILKALEKADSSQRRFLEDILGAGTVSEADLEEVRRIVVDTGALASCKELARRLALEAREALAGAPWRPEGRAFLEGAVAFMIEREY